MFRRFRVSLLLLLAPSVLLLVAAKPAVSAASFSPHLRRYPYLTDVVSSYGTVNWATDRSISTGAVRYGQAGAESCRAHYVPASRTAITVNGVAEYQWKAMLNLQPDTKYCYRVYLGSSAATEIDLLASDSSPSFWTQVPAGSSEPYSFVVLADWGYVDSNGNNPHQAKLMSLIAGTGARFALTAGDNSYPAGSQTNYGDLVQSGPNISGVFGPLFWKVPGSFTPIFLASGNHGFSNSDPVHPLLLNFPQDRAVADSGGRYRRDTYCCVDGTSSGNYPSAWYAFDAGLARIYVLDSAWSDSNTGSATPYKIDYDYKWTQSSPEYLWLKADLASHPSALKFAVWHFPMYSDDPNNVSDTYLRGNSSLEGLLYQYGVDVGFSGHAHIYERNRGSPVKVTNYIAGGGGAPLTTLGPCSSWDAYALKFTSSGGRACPGTVPPPTSADQVYHFIQVTINGTQAKVTPINALGSKFDSQTYDFSAGSENNAPSTPAGLGASALTGTQVNLTWGASSDDTAVRGYDIYRNGQLLATTNASTLSFSDTSVEPSASYVYTVDAFDGSGNHSAQSASAAASTPDTATYVFTPVADAYVASDSPGVNGGLASLLKTDASPTYNSYLRFNVSDIKGTVMQATLQLYSTQNSATGYQARAASAGTWEENQITYSNAPGAGPVIDTSGALSSGSFAATDVTSLITGNGSYDLAVTTTSTSSLAFYSRDAGDSAQWPRLVITTRVLPPTATPTSTPTSTPTNTPTATPTNTPTPAPVPAFSADPASAGFGIIEVGKTSAARAFTITNAGSGDLVISKVALAGLNPGQFYLASESCTGASLAAGQSCTVKASFKPASAGKKQAVIRFTDNTGSPHSIALRGKGGMDQAINGGFNIYPSTTAMIPTGWTATRFAATDGRSTTAKYEGAASVAISNTQATTKLLVQNLSISGAAGSTFQLSAWASGQDVPATAGLVRARVQLFNGSTPVQSAFVDFPSGTYAFTPKRFTFIASGAYDRVTIRLIYSKAGGTAWFDGLKLLLSP